MGIPHRVVACRVPPDVEAEFKKLRDELRALGARSPGSHGGINLSATAQILIALGLASPDRERLWAFLKERPRNRKGLVTR